MGSFGSDDPWFRVGNVDVNTTVFVVGLGVVSMFLWAIEGAGGPILSNLVFIPEEVVRGQVWRLITWPIPNQPDIWTIILFAVFFMLGSQLEAAMGRKLFTTYLVLLVVGPAFIMSLVHLLTGMSGGAVGLRLAEIGILVGFAARNPKAMFWPGIPAWGIAGFIVVLELLRDTGYRQSFSIMMLLITVGIALLALRGLGFAEEASWIPKIALPAAAGSSASTATRGSRAKTTSRRKKRGRAKLSAVPAQTEAPRKQLSKLEEAEMDMILEQVSEQGLDSLTPQQRKRLEDHSKRLRRRGD